MKCRGSLCRMARRSMLYPDVQDIDDRRRHPERAGERTEAQRLEEGLRLLEGEGVYADEDPTE